MLAALVAVVLAAPAGTIELTPTDDIWVYPHASDPQKDGYLRVWGVDGSAVASDPQMADEYSYSYLKFNVSKVPKDAKVRSVKLLLTHTPDPAWAAADSKAAPLEARLLAKDFSEKQWEFGSAKTIYPAAAKEAILGTAYAGKLEAGKPTVFEMDLTKASSKLLGKSDDLLIALTSALNPSAIGNRAVYKFYSKDYDKAEYRPKLVVETD